jgi:hypothetical protein
VKGAFIALVTAIAPGDELYLACRGKDRHVALKATVAEPRNKYQGTQALDQLEDVRDRDTIEVLEFLYPDNTEHTVFRLEAIEPCYIDLSAFAAAPMSTIQQCPSFILGGNAPGDDQVISSEMVVEESQESDFRDEENAISVLASMFPYIGEFILETCMNSCLEKLPAIFECENVRAVHRQCKLGFPNSGVWFDGSGTLDLALELEDGNVIPVELKLGYNGLAKSSIEKILKPCGLSLHTNETRIRGKVPAALNQSFDNEVVGLVGEERLHAFIRNQWRPVSTDWRMIIRRCIEKSWSQKPPVGFSSGFKHVLIEDLCSAIGEKDFNETVESFFRNRNFFKLWIGE